MAVLRSYTEQDSIIGSRSISVFPGFFISDSLGMIVFLFWKQGREEGGGVDGQIEEECSEREGTGLKSERFF